MLQCVVLQKATTIHLVGFFVQEPYPTVVTGLSYKRASSKQVSLPEKSATKEVFYRKRALQKEGSRVKKGPTNIV